MAHQRQGRSQQSMTLGTGTNKVGQPMVPLHNLLNNELQKEVVENPNVYCGLAIQTKKSEDFPLAKLNCQRIPGDDSSTYSVFAVCSRKIIRNRLVKVIMKAGSESHWFHCSFNLTAYLYHVVVIFGRCTFVSSWLTWMAQIVANCWHWGNSPYFLSFDNHCFQKTEVFACIWNLGRCPHWADIWRSQWSCSSYLFQRKLIEWCDKCCSTWPQ